METAATAFSTSCTMQLLMPRSCCQTGAPLPTCLGKTLLQCQEHHAAAKPELSSASARWLPSHVRMSDTHATLCHLSAKQLTLQLELPAGTIKQIHQQLCNADSP
jgi:hypothetical protein